MNVGRVISALGRMAPVALVLIAAVTVVSGGAFGQTPDAVCAADSLYLMSPASLDLRLETTGKSGLTVSWPNLDFGQATCFALGGTEDLLFGVEADGGYGDRVDRIFRFTTADSGRIGTATPDNIAVTWQSQGSSVNGSIGGTLNLANNGGIWQHAGAAGWSQVNNGLPIFWRLTNTVALARGTGDYMVAAFTRLNSLDANPAGLYAYNGVNWVELAPDVFGENTIISDVVIAPDTDNRSFAVGTRNKGLFVTDDGGETFTQWTSELDPAFASQPTTYRVTALNWESNRLLVALPAFGLFISADGGQSFSRSPIQVPESLDVANPEMVLPIINDFSVDPANPNRIVAALEFHGTYETTDGGLSWSDLYGDLVVAQPTAGAWVHSAREVLIDAADSQVIVMAVSQKGIFRTADGGASWVRVADNLYPTDGPSSLQQFKLIRRPGLAGEMLLLGNEWGLMHSTDSGATWNLFAEQPVLNTAVELVPHREPDGQFLVGTHSGGIYVGDSWIELSEAYGTVTDPNLRSLDLGLRIRFEQDGLAEPDDTFDLVAQTFQGWAVWRAPGSDPRNMTMIGIYDRVNPEDCFEGYCGDNSLEVIPDCFAAKRAACFDISDPDTIRFFDAEVYNGFTYEYAVTSFDYGNTALIAALNNTNEMLFSPRWTGDVLSPFGGTGNNTRIAVNAPAQPAGGDEEVYAFPNPVRLGAGVPRGEGNLVVFTNLPPGSRVRVFTTAGDDVINLGPDNQVGAQIYWRTVNRDGAEVAPGVYLYKVVMPEREDHWGRIVVIR